MMDPRLPEDFVPESNRNDNRSSAAGIQIFNIGKTSLILLATFAGLALGISIYALMNTFTESQRTSERIQANENAARERERQLSELFEARMQTVLDADRIAEREARVLQERVSDMKVELTRRGIPVSDH